MPNLTKLTSCHTLYVAAVKNYAQAVLNHKPDDAANERAVALRDAVSAELSARVVHLPYLGQLCDDLAHIYGVDLKVIGQ